MTVVSRRSGAPSSFEHLEQVIDLRVKGMRSKEIAIELGLPKHVVEELVESWRDIVAKDHVVMGRSREAVANADINFSDLIAEAWTIVRNTDDDPGDPKMMAQKSVALKLIGDLEQKRFTMLKDLGALDHADVAADIAERERREEIILGILKTDLCPSCKRDISGKLQQLTGKVEPVQVIVQDD